MDVPATGALPGQEDGQPDRHRFDRDRSLRALRARWRTASLASGWRFPSDWALPEVDAVCAAVVKGNRIVAADIADIALAGLGRARAAAGAGLAETLADLAALHAVLADPGAIDGFVTPDVDSTPARLLRVTALAWADVATDQLTNTEVTEPLTGLPTSAYLRTRLAEIYRQSARDERPVADDHVLFVVAMDFSEVAGWPRLTGMILVADALRSVFDGGESVASLGPSTAGALVPKNAGLASQGVALRRALNDRLSVDAQLREVEQPRISAVRLPATHDLACDLLRTLGRG
ncbi:GGDEF domain-containing protein [Amycolatopsis sp. H20-H5]|uniref:GGDEF domain-containing protein n=1 Tax=Amycolatopsis sp. H20-H5 TaxID=3046309 RepID=UPI002DBD8E58|nr:GGDEF domain-containing protein [Amycolatopsis sp. H20-H5]MEC3978084.1 GGDEF domain-containing protein [Amycolatopsis sp. H20-H5]